MSRRTRHARRIFAGRPPSRRLFPCGLAALLAGCTMGPDFHPPAVKAPAHWGSEPAAASRTVDTEIDISWWRSFADPELNWLIDRLARQNLDLQTAAERIRQSRAQTDVVRSQGLPDINGQVRYTRTRQSPTGFLQLIEPRPGAPLEYDLFQQGLSASWDLDLFGRVRRGVEAGRADTQAAIEARHAVALAATADLATDYMQLRGLQAELSITESNLALARRNTRLVENQLANGVANTLELAQARAQQASIGQALPTLRADQAAMINAIGLLLGLPPRALAGELLGRADQPLVPPVVPVGLPGTLVRQRPDVREAEARLHEATADTGEAVAAFYPDITLTGMLDTEGLKFKDLFNFPSHAFTTGPALSIPIFQGGRLRATLELRRSQQREAAIAFQNTVLRAWQEVDDALTAYAAAQNRRALVLEAFRENQLALAAARQRYVQGVSDFLNVIEVQAALLQSQSALASSQTQIDTDLVALYRALGGGWQIADPPPVQPAPPGAG